jgi:hypothetical protein
LEDGDMLIQRADYSRYPKDTTIAISRPIKMVLAVMKIVEEYSNFDELVWSLIERHDNFRSLPEFLVKAAERDLWLKTQARTKAKQKGRYFPSEQRKPKDYDLIKKGIAEMKENMANDYRKKKRLTSADVERFLQERRDRERRR